MSDALYTATGNGPSYPRGMELDAAPRKLAVALLGPHPLGDDPTREQDAYRSAIHESGHAVCALHVGATFERVQIRPSALLVGPRYPSDEARIVGSLGGALAELLVLGDVVPEGVRTDMARALRLADGDALAVRRTAPRVASLLRHRGAALRALASALLDSGELSFDECHALLEGVRRG